MYATLAALAALAGLAAFTVYGRSARSQVASPSPGPRPSLSGGAAGGKVAFVSYSGGGQANHGTVYVVNAEGSGQRRLARGVWEQTPVWSPDGRRLAFVRGLGGPNVADSEVYVVNVDGSGERRLTHTPGNEVSLAWSPDGRKIAFTRFISGQVIGLYVMNADGSGQRRLTRNAFGGAVWSPDGTKLVGGIGGKPGIWVINADGSGMRRLTSISGDGPSAWSPDGRKLAFVRFGRCLRCCAFAKLYVMNADGSGQKKLASGALIGLPAWSPDARTIAYDRSYRPKPNTPRLQYMHITEVFVVNADGSAKRRLTHGARPFWSPDGRAIAYTRSGQRLGGLYVMNADGSGQPLKLAPNARGGAAWAPARLKR
jgi:TolB protein